MSVDQPTGFVKYQSLSDDAFLGGRLHVLQPAMGFRAGLDSVLLGASVDATRLRLLDLGAGAGVAALVALRHVPAASAVLAERDPGMAELAERNLARNGCEGRARVARLDVTASGAERAGAGLIPDSFDCVIANPPFFAAGEGTPALDAGRASARHMDQTTLARWLRTAAATAAPGGEAIFIAPAAGLAHLLSAMHGRFGGIAIRPIAPRDGAEASRVLVRGIKGSRAPLRLLAPLVLHGREGHGFVPEIEAILRGNARLHW